MRKLLSALNITFFIVATLMLYGMGRGWQVREGELIRTGILDLYSYPSKADIYIGAELYGKTHKAIRSIEPGTYQITISKPDYYPWQKQLTVVEELVTKPDDIRLFPQNAIVEPVVTAAHMRFDRSPDHSTIVGHHTPLKAATIDLIHPSGNIFFTTSVVDTTYFSWNPDGRYLLFFGEPIDGLVQATLIDSKDNLATDYTFNSQVVFPFINAPSREHVCWDAEKPILIYSTGKSLSEFSFKTQDTVSYLTTAQTAIPLLNTEPRNILDNPDLYLLQQEPNGQRFDLWKVVNGTEAPEQITTQKLYDQSTSSYLSPDQTSVILRTDSVVTVIDGLDTDEPQEIIIPDLEFLELLWSPDSEKVLFELADDQLAQFDLASKELSEIYQSDQASLTEFTWLGDSSHIFLLLADQQDNTQLLVMDSDGTNEHVLIETNDSRLQELKHELSSTFLLSYDSDRILFSTYSTEAFALGTHIHSMELK